MTRPRIDETHDRERSSWVESARDHSDFPIQNLPLGVFSHGSGPIRGGVAIGDHVVDLAALSASDLLEGAARQAAASACSPTLNTLLALGAGPRQALRLALSRLLSDRGSQGVVSPMLLASKDCELHLPAAVGDYTDFFTGMHHALNVGRLIRPDAPLLPNYKHIPIGYHGRASTVRPSGTPVLRPRGQLKSPTADRPRLALTEQLDFELELGAWIAEGSENGCPVPLAQADCQLAGLCLLNDWSARDIQAWEYQPPGPFLGKSFLTTVSPWLVTAEALAPFRTQASARSLGDPTPLDYLLDPDDEAFGGFAIELEVRLSTEGMRLAGLEPVCVTRSAARHMYWTVGQMIAHHTSNGCSLRPGDLLGSGTLSGPLPENFGCLLEKTCGGSERIVLPSGETRAFLEDGDEVTFSGRTTAEGFASIGFGPCTGRVEATSSGKMADD